MVERQPSKLRVAGSNPVSRSIRQQSDRVGSCQQAYPAGIRDSVKADCWQPGSFENAHVAQSAEHILGKDEVTSSILVMGSRKDS